MKIQRIELKNFKRFTDLELDEIPNDNKLVLLIGSNGSGKSCLLDALGYANNKIRKDTAVNDEYHGYFKKNKANGFEINITFSDGQQLSVSEKEQDISFPAGVFYGRTSFRQVPRLTRTALGQNGVSFEKDSDRPKFFIDRDLRFENDLEKITEIILKELFRGNQSNRQIKEKYIEPINRSLRNIFGDRVGTQLELLEIIPPLEGNVAQINFRKGESEIHYNYLSAGEKEVFNILVNLLSRRELYRNSIFFYDEIDLHLNTKIQYLLLKEITENWLPENCQFWTASHSLGFIEYARNYEKAVIFDLDELDFDKRHVLVPEQKSRPEIFEIAVGKELLPSLFRDKKIFFVENSDNVLFSNCKIEDVVFVSASNRDNVYHKVRATQFHGIVDRDFLSDDDIAQISHHYPNLCILAYYSIENYLYHPDNLEEYYSSRNQKFDKHSYISRLVSEKNEILASIVPSLSMKRLGYPYFGEPIYNGNPLQKRFKNEKENIDQAAAVSSGLRSDEFASFYKSLPMKSYGKNIPERQNIHKIELSKTDWFGQSMRAIIAFGPKP